MKQNKDNASLVSNISDPSLQIFSIDYRKFSGKVIWATIVIKAKKQRKNSAKSAEERMSDSSHVW